MLKRDKAAYNESNKEIADLHTQIIKAEHCLLSAKETGNSNECNNLKDKIRDIKYELAECSKENKILKKQLKNTIRYCETFVEKRVLPPMSSSGMGRFVFLPKMRSKITGRIAEYSLVHPNNESQN